jgi:hypothetical protein
MSGALRGQRMAREIKYSDWSKVCFKTPGTSMVYRTSITGTFETGQSAVGIDLIEKATRQYGWNYFFPSACTCRPASKSPSTMERRIDFPMSGA